MNSQCKWDCCTKSYQIAELLTSCTWLCQQLKYDVIISVLVGDTRILDEFLFDSNADIITRQQLFQLLKGLLKEANSKEKGLIIRKVSCY